MDEKEYPPVSSTNMRIEYCAYSATDALLRAMLLASTTNTMPFAAPIYPLNWARILGCPGISTRRKAEDPPFTYCVSFT